MRYENRNSRGADNRQCGRRARNLADHADVARMYTDNIDALCRRLLLDFDGDDLNDADTLAQLRTLQMVRRDILTLAFPPDDDLPKNDTPTASF